MSSIEESEYLPSEPSPPEKRRKSSLEKLSFVGFIKAMAESVPFQLLTEQDTRHRMLEILQFMDAQKEVVVVPVHDTFKELVAHLWEHPISVPLVNRKMDTVYLAHPYHRVLAPSAPSPIGGGRVCLEEGGRNVRKFHYKPLQIDGRGDGRQNLSAIESISRAVPSVSSKARGKDRLTGRARRWDAKDGESISCTVEGIPVQVCRGNPELEVEHPSYKKVENDSTTTLQEESLELPDGFLPLGQSDKTVLLDQEVAEEKKKNEMECKEAYVPNVFYAESEVYVHQKGVQEDEKCGSDPLNQETNMSIGAAHSTTYASGHSKKGKRSTEGVNVQQS
ncbi:uncharacterized protein LOC115089353 [Rhinatrema bivittatum]|uniref:uncharacterized protein LOC115089353 n=1 Tax=Rhinatrema bivittatum TaxID=194408 RepID=UPI00112C46D4|nr:uncharacterized protein LOC115089353 [Rhinatrema bivittatum]